MRYVVGYVPNDRGRDAVNMAAALAANRAASVDIVVVMPPESRAHGVYAPDRSHFSELQEQQGREHLDAAASRLPDDVAVRTLLRRAESTTEGLIEAATDPDLGEEAGLIIIGASHRGLRGRFTIGSVATALLHSAPVPVALAPAGYTGVPAVTRLTCAIGTREGAEALLNVAVQAATGRRIPLRLMSLVALGQGRDTDVAAESELAKGHGESLVAKAEAAMPNGGSDVTSVVGQGESIEEAVRALDFSNSEIVLVGSSRLAGPMQLFIGASANRMLRALPVPMVVVPRNYRLPAEARADTA